MSEWLTALPSWAWAVIVLVAAIAVAWLGFQIWLAAYRAILPDRGCGPPPHAASGSRMMTQSPSTCTRVLGVLPCMSHMVG